MHKLTVIVGNFCLLAVLPIVTLDRETDDRYVFCDHRNSPQQRAAVIAPLARELDVDTFHVNVIDAAPAHCDLGYHLWASITKDAQMVGAKCQRCGYAEAITALPIPIVDRPLPAVS